MGKYLKMADYFVTGTFSADYGDIHSVIKYKPSAEGLTCRAAHYAVEHAINSHDELVAEVGLLRSVCAEAYQIAGALDAPVEVLDNLSAAANGEDLPHETFLPVASHDLIAEVERLRSENQSLMKCRMAAREFFNCTVASGGLVKVSSSNKAALDEADKASDWLEIELKATADLVEK